MIYDKAVAKVRNDEDEETLAAIDEGIRDAKAGRVVPADEVRKLLPNRLSLHLHNKRFPNWAYLMGNPRAIIHRQLGKLKLFMPIFGITKV